MFSAIPLQYYSAVFYALMFVMCLCYGVTYSTSNTCDRLLKKHSVVPVVLFATLLTLYIGFRPISWIFADMRMYAHTYENMNISFVVGKAEWVFSFLMVACRFLGLSAQQFFVLVAFLYIFLCYHACSRMLPENAMMAFLFVISAFSFWGYGTNGIRNGLASSLVLLGMAYALDKRWLSALLLMYMATGIHRSMTLPIMMFIVASFMIKKPKTAIYFWLISIVLSLILGAQITNFFAGLGFDDRLANYAVMSSSWAYQFSHVGFRWDFLLYSAMPVALTWYITEIQGVQHRTFNILANTYILSNAFWVMVIQSAFSNRFAYLSWFMYPIVLAYAFIRVPIWEDQDKKIGWALLAHASFTLFMFVIGKLY